jgi:uncharacterized membrane protein
MSPEVPERGNLGPGVRDYVRRSLLTGLALTVPLLVTVLVLVFALDFLANALDPLVIGMERSFGFTESLSRVALQAIAASLLVGIILVVGTVAESQYGGGRIERRVDETISRIPGIGSIYESLNEMSKVLLSRDTDSFKEVKLVEYPGPGSYTLAFLTAEPGEAVKEATGHQEMVSLFMPMAPNPFMGGFVIHVSADQVYDVDMTVEEGIQAIVSSGIAVDERTDDPGSGPDAPDDYGIDENDPDYGPGSGDGATDPDRPDRRPGGRL